MFFEGIAFFNRVVRLPFVTVPEIVTTGPPYRCKLAFLKVKFKESSKVPMSFVVLSN